MSCKVVSLDTSSSSTGWAYFIDGEILQHGCITSKIKDSEKRMKEMCLSALQLLNNINPDIVYVEKMSVERNPGTARMLSMIIGVIYGWCISHEKYYEDFRPSEWRSLIKNKDEKIPRKREELKFWSQEKVRTIYGFEVNDDESDAILIGRSAIIRYS